MKKEPVLIVLGALWAVLGAGLAMLNALGVTHLDGAQLTAIGTFVTAVTGTAALVIRASVSPAGQAQRDGYFKETLVVTPVRAVDAGNGLTRVRIEESGPEYITFADGAAAAREFMRAGEAADELFGDLPPGARPRNEDGS